MRTAKYNDYRALRVLLFIALVVLIGVLAFKNFSVNKPCEHTATKNSWVTVEATCTEDGYRYKVCSKCGEQFGNQVLAATGHKIDNNVVTIEEATCTKTGTGYKPCSVCKEELEFVELPIIDHTPGEVKVENNKEHTFEQGASYENVVYCTECDEELSRKMVNVEHTVKITETIELNPDCVNEGIKNVVYYCLECDKELYFGNEAIPALGHEFVWELVYDGEISDFVLHGECADEDCGHEFDPCVDTEYTYDPVTKCQDASLEPTCIAGYDIYATSIYKNGELFGSVELKVNVDPVMDHVLNVKITDANGNFIIDPTGYMIDEEGYIVDADNNRIDFLKANAQYDENGYVYYNISTPGIQLVYDRTNGQTQAEAMNAAWDENGFALGVYKCTNVTGEGEHWITVRVYNDLA